MTFQGKCGPSVEGLPESFKNKSDNERAELDERYDEDPVYRKTMGPSIELYLETGYLHSLDDLQIDIDFGNLGSVRGICKYVPNSSTGESEKLNIEWRIGPDFNANTAFISKHDNSNADEKMFLGLYFQDRVVEYVSPMKQSVVDFIKRARAAPKGTAFVNWKRPNDYEAADEFENINDEDEWYITLAKLNDPRMAHHYGDGGYTTLSVLTLYIICVNCHWFDTFPIMVTKENEQMFEIADDFCQQISGSRSYSTGYGNLTAFERICKNIIKNFPPMEAKSNYNVWKGGYDHAQGLMLVLSNNFEQAMWDYTHVDDPNRVEDLHGDFLCLFGSYMNPASAPSDTAREQLQRDLDFNDEHLRAGVFVVDAENEHKELFASTVAMCLKNVAE